MAWTRWNEIAARPDDPAQVALLDALFGNSPYLTETALQNPTFMTDLWRRGPDAVRADLAAELAAVRSTARDGAAPAAVATALRRLKRQVALAVAVADIAEAWSLEQVTGALSAFASGCLDALTDSILLQLARDGQLGIGTDPEAAALTVLGMGKLGAGELNYSSDIDLILLYDRDAAALAGNDQLSRHFVRAARMLVQLMSETSADGYIFRTDLRLRPDPGSTPLAMSVQAAELYYESVGQNWERAAMIKAHPVAGNRAVGEAFLGDLHALYLAQAPRLRGDPRHPLDQAPDRRPSRRQRRQGAGPQRQAGPRRHPRDRVLRPDPAADLRRTQSRAARPRDLRDAARAGRRRPRRAAAPPTS